MKLDLFVEYEHKKVDYKQLSETAKQIWKDQGQKVKDLTSMELYFKPEENKCYYIFNGEENGFFVV